MKPDRVLFVRLDDAEENPVLSVDVFYSNYGEDGYYYLLNPPPGRYVAVAAVKTTAGTPRERPEPAHAPPGWPEGSQPPSREMQGALDIAVYFREDLVRETEVTTEPGSLSFMGDFLVHTSPLRGPDPVQAHFFRLLQPGESSNILVQVLYQSQGTYGGAMQTMEHGAAARGRFSRKASEHLSTAGWGAMLNRLREGPTQ